MTLVICVDDRDGVSFCGRRLSSDRAVRRHLLSLAGSAKLYMTAYSASEFLDDSDRVCVAEDFYIKADSVSFCFLENSDPEDALQHAQRLILYRWNRRYPSDVKLPDISVCWHLVDTGAFEGFSHPAITWEVYERVC